jgi:hypothetical protein
MAAGDLCTVEQVASWRRDVTGGARDALIARAITAASAVIARHTGRHFAIDLAPSARRYAVAGPDVPIGDLSAAPTLVRLVADVGDLVGDVTNDVVALPLNRDGTPVTGLRVPGYGGPRDGSRLLEVTGIWGWPSVPADVQEACVDVVCSWLDIGAGLSDASGERFEPGLPVGRALTLRAKELLRPYRRRMGLT